MIKSIEELPLKGKRLFLRLDLNVPLQSAADNPELISIADDTRIREALPTIKYAYEKGAKVVIASHLGRPSGPDPKLSLEPVAQYLSTTLANLGVDVVLADDCVGDGIHMMVKHLAHDQILVLENLRFHPEEEANDLNFARELASLADIYVTDAFGAAHRKHASTYGMAQIMPIRGCGFLIKKELKFLGQLLKSPQHPFIAVLGGSKVSDKIKTIENLMHEVDALIIGGAMGNAFRIALGETVEIPSFGKKPKAEEIEAAKNVIQKAEKHEVELVLPVDDVDSCDIGPRSIEKFTAAISSAKTIFWNGPMGVFENDKYARGTTAVAEAIAEINGLKIVGGGDTVSAAHQAGVAEKMSHISTGGGASLEFLEGKPLPGIEILETYGNKF